MWKWSRWWDNIKALGIVFGLIVTAAIAYFVIIFGVIAIIAITLFYIVKVLNYDPDQDEDKDDK